MKKQKTKLKGYRMTVALMSELERCLFALKCNGHTRRSKAHMIDSADLILKKAKQRERV